MLLQYAPHLLARHLVDRGAGGAATCARLDGVVLVVDIVDSTGLTDEYARQGSAGAERLAALLNADFGRIIAIAEAHGGDIFKIDGDAVIVVWHDGAAAASTDPSAARAAGAALAMRADFDRADDPTAGSVRHRLTLVAGALDFIVFTQADGRGYCVLDGVAIRGLGAPALRGSPGQVVVSDEARARLPASARLTPAACGAWELQALPAAAPAAREPARAAPAPDVALEALVRPYVPQVLIDRTVAGQSDWIAEFRRLTVLYLDLRGLAPGTAGIEARVEDAVRRIAAVVDALGIPITNVVANEKGFVVQVACGLPPFAREHGATLAVRAALRIRQSLAPLGIPAAIGITTGDAFCGDIGSTTRREYLSTGPVMAYAARLMQAAQDEILCDDATARAAAGDAEFSAVRILAVKGRAEPLPVRAVHGLAPPVSGVPLHPGPLFGRDAEMRLLRERLAALPGRHGGVVAIEAEPGAGKTHLLAHAAEAAQRCGYLTATAATSPVEATTAYFALRALLPALLRQPEDPPELAPDVLRARIVAQVRDPPLAHRLALLEDVLPLAFDDPGLAPEIKGQARLSGIVDIVLHLARAAATRAPVVVVVDDVQWLDGSTAHVLASLLRRVPRTLAIVARRSADTPSAPHVRSLLAAANPRLGLSRLPGEAIAAIVRERLGVPDVPATLAAFIESRSEGLPFFAEQLLFSMRDHGVVTLAEGKCTVATDALPDLATPDSVRDLIVSRIDRLPPPRQFVLKVASAVGRVFDARTVQEVHPLHADLPALEDALDRLTEAGFLSRHDDQGHTVFAFRHNIIQGVTYDLLPYAQRRPLHRSIALHLEAAARGALAPHYATLADHWERAADAGRAIPFRIGAAEIAAQRYANHDVLDHLDRIERLVTQFGVRLAPRDRARCTHLRADACQELTRFAEANDHYRKLATLEHIAVPRTRMETVWRIGRESVLQALRRMGIVRSLSEGDERERDGLAAHIYMRIAEHAYFTNDTLGLAHATLASLNYAERAQALPEIVNASGGLALGLSAVGLLREAGHYRERSIELANNAGSPSAQGFAELLACVQSFHTGDWDRMGVHGARGARIWKDLGDRYRHQACLVLEAYRMMATGHYDRADRALAAFGERGEEIESVQVRAWALAARALVDLVLGRPPAVAIERLATASAAGDLNPAERLLCNGIAAAAHLEAGDDVAALRAAESGLANITQGSPAMAGALLFSVPSIAEVLLVLAQRPEAVDRPREALLALSRTACREARRFAARNRICRPRASLLRGHLAATRGRSRAQQGHYSEALADAERLGLPLEQAMSHAALAAVDGPAAARDAHRRAAAAILERLGVAWAPWQRLRY